MARKRRAPSPAPPPPLPPPQESSTETGSVTGEEDSPLAAAPQKQPQNPQLHHLAAAANGADSSEEESDSDADAQAFQMRPVPRSLAKPAAPVPQPTDADEEEEDGESLESEPEVPDPVPKKVAVAKKSKTIEKEDKKRPALEPAPSRKGKKAKAEPGNAAPEASSTGMGKKAKAEPEKSAAEATPSGKAKKPRVKPEKSGLNSPPPSSKSEKSARALRAWSKEDSIKILEAIAAHVKSEGRLPKTDFLAAVRDSLDRKDCNYADLYERVRRLKERYEETVSNGVLPSEEDELHMYNLSEAIWGDKAKEAITAAAALQNGSTAMKSKKGEANKEKMDGSSKGGTSKEVVNQNGDTRKVGKKGQAINGKADMDVKRKMSKEDSATGTLTKTKKQGNEREELGENVKSGTSKETVATVTKNGDTLRKPKRQKMDIDHMPKVASTGRQNGGSQTEDVTHHEEKEIGATLQGMHRSFDELRNLYPSLAWSVERMAAQHPCGESLKRAFELIHDEKANVLESKMKKQIISEVKVQVRRVDVSKEVLNMLISPAD